MKGTMRIRRNTLVSLSLIGAAGLMFTGCSASTSNAESNGEASTITLYTSEPQEKIDEVIAAFNKKHPEITVDVFRAGTGELTTRIATEQKNGEVEADILLAADAGTFEDYASDDLLLKYSPADVEKLDENVVDPEGFYVGTRIIPTAIAYNTTMISTPPTSWADLTDPQYKGKITMPNPDVSGAAAYNAAVWMNTPELGVDWISALAANEPVIAESNGPVSQAIASGTQPVGVVVDYLVRDLKSAGSPIDVVYPSEGVPFVSQPAGIFANTDEEEASKTFIDFLVSEEGQKIAVDQAYMPVRDDVGTPEGAPELGDLAVLMPDLDVIRDSQDSAVERFNELFS